jgi:hypothetical protein
LAFLLLALLPVEPALAEKNLLREVYFGETHVHTSWSFDAYIFGNTITGMTGDYFPNHIQFVSTNLVWKFEQLPLGLRLRRRMGENLSQKSAGVLRGCYSQTLGTKPHFFYQDLC